jgi:hypothetical protein
MKLRPWVLAVNIILAAGCRPQAATPAAPSVPAPPTRFLVTIVVDQLAAWMADERWPALPADGGFARLQREGLYVRELHLAHAVTDTAPGHAALYTGAVPHASGIVANDVLGATGKKVSSLLDASTRLVPAGAPGPIERPGSSLATLQVDTLADALVAARPDAQVYSFSLKDRGALFAAGRRPTLTLWLDTEGGTLATSTAFAPAVPAWAAPFGDAAAVARASAPAWEPMDAAWVGAHAATPDNQPGEGDYLGLGITFPHHVKAVKALRATPAGDRLLLDLARAAAAHAAENAGRPVLLALSLSSNDYVNHVFGPDSWEAWDELRRLDRGLAELFAALDTLVGPDRWAVILAGDHGSNPLPELSRTGQAPWCRRGAGGDHWQRPCGRAGRLIPSEVARQLDDDRKVIAAVIDPLVYLTPRGSALPPDERAALRKRIESVLGGEIAQVIDVRAAAQTCPPPADESLPALICRSMRPGQVGDFFLVPKPGFFFDPDLAEGKGTSHGSAYLYDRTVPMLVRAPGRIEPGSKRTASTSYSAFTRTAAALLGIPEPAGLAGSDGPDLTRTH